MTDEVAKIDEQDIGVIAGLVERYGVEAVVAAARGSARPGRKAGRPKNSKNSDASLVSIWAAIHRLKLAGRSTTDAARALWRDLGKNSSGPRLTARRIENIYYEVEARRRDEPAIGNLCALVLAGLESAFAQLGIDPEEVVILPSGGIGPQKR